MYIYGILSHSIADPVSGADIVFSIDGVQQGTFTFTPTGPQGAYTYNQLLFAIEGLEEASHVLMFQNRQIGGPISLVLFDYLVYSK